MRLGSYYRYELLNQLEIFSNIQADDRILDIGGFDGLILSNIDCKHKTLIDKEANEIFDNINYIKKDIFDHDFHGHDFNWIFSFDVLEHLPLNNERLIFVKINSLLEIKGTAYLTVPSRNIRVFPKILTGWTSLRWGHVKCLGYTKEELINLINETSLKYDIIELNSRSYLNYYLIIKILELIFPVKTVKHILAILAKKDSRDNIGNEGFYLIKLKKL